MIQSVPQIARGLEKGSMIISLLEDRSPERLTEWPRITQSVAEPELNLDCFSLVP